MKKKLGILLSIAMIGMFCFNGCSSTSTANGGNIKVLLTLNSMDTFRQMLVDAAQEEASAEGVQLDVMDAEESIENQVEHIKTAVAEDYDVIICGPVSADTVVELKANAGDTPIIFINSCPDDRRLESGKDIYVGSDESVAGQFQAEYVLDKFADKDEINVVLLKGPKNHSATNGRTSGAKQTLEASGKKINYVFEDYANWDTEQAKEMFEIFLKTGSPVDCVICNNDGMALGVVEACKEAKIDLSELPILGVDATADGCTAIENGEMAFTVYQSAVGQGEAAIEAAVKFAKGESIGEVEGVTEDEKYVWVPFERVDSSNVSEYK
ncbi:MAG: sugar ABC transporter substrate-binding protein [Roseburia sp.]